MNAVQLATQMPPLNVLLVEDNPDDAYVLQRTLNAEAPGSFTITHADRLETGLTRLSDGGLDEILLDLSLPDAQGLETLARTRAVAATVPIVVLTGSNDQALAACALRAGAQDYLVKGQTDDGMLVRALRYAVERQRWTTELERKGEELTRSTLERQQIEAAFGEQRRRLVLRIAEDERLAALGRERHLSLRRQRAALLGLVKRQSRTAGARPLPVREVSEVAAQTLGAERAGIWLCNHDRTVLHCADLYEAAFETHSSGSTLTAVRAPGFFEALDEGRTISAVRAEEDRRVAELIDASPGAQRAQSILIAPIQTPDGLRGILVLESTAELRTWSPDEEAFLASLADLVAHSLQASQSGQGATRVSVTNNRLAATARRVPGVLFDIDEHGVFTIAEGAGLSNLGLTSPHALVGSSFGEIFMDSPMMLGAIRRTFLGEASSAIITDRGASFQVTCVPVRDTCGQITHLAGTMTGVAMRTDARHEQRNDASKLEALTTLADRSGHIFRERLLVIGAKARDALDELPRESSARVSVKRIYTAALGALRHSAELLTFAGKRGLSAHPLDVSALVYDLAPALNAWAGKSAVQYRLAPDLARTTANVAELRQMLMNLVRNAAAATTDVPGGVVTVTTRMADADDAYTYEAGTLDAPVSSCVSLEVTDTGTGMDAVAQRRIFDPFYTTSVTGRGLGLSVVFGLVRARGGTIRVRSAVNSGTTVRVLLPTYWGVEDRVALPSENHGRVPLVRAAGLVPGSPSAVRTIAASSAPS